MDDRELLRAWDVLNVAIGRMLNAQPHQMTQAASSVERLQDDFNSLIRRAGVQAKENDNG